MPSTGRAFERLAGPWQRLAWDRVFGSGSCQRTNGEIVAPAKAVRLPRWAGEHIGVSVATAWSLAALVASLVFINIAVTVPVAAQTTPTVAITSDAGNDRFYTTGDNIDVTVTFNGTVTVTGTPTLHLTIGNQSRPASYESATGATVAFRYGVVAGDLDSDGVVIPMQDIALPSGASIQVSGVDANLTLAEHVGGREHKVDTGTRVAPSFTHVFLPVVPSLTLTIREHSTAMPGNRLGGVPTTNITSGQSREYLSYELTGGDDRFAIDDSGAVTYVGGEINYEDPGSTGASLMYALTVTVRNIAGSATRSVTVEVEDEDDPAVFSPPIASLTPQVGVPIQMSVSDEDGTPTNVDWGWYYEDSTAEDGVRQIPGANSSRYAPQASDFGRRLQVAVAYREGDTSGPQRTVQSEFTAAVVAAANQPPEFPAATVEIPFGDPDEPEYVHYETFLQENQAGNPTAVELALVHATDPDGNPITYRIAKGNRRGVWQLDENSGLLSYVGSGEDYENLGDESIDDYFLLTIEAMDAPIDGSDGSVASAVVMVRVVNVQEPGAVELKRLNVSSVEVALDGPPAALDGDVEFSGDRLIAELTDVDGVTANPKTWTWETSPNRLPREWTAIRTQTQFHFFPNARFFRKDGEFRLPESEVGKLLRVRVQYRDSVSWRLPAPAHTVTAMTGEFGPIRATGETKLWTRILTDERDRVGGPFPVTVEFEEPVTGFTESGISTTNATVGNFAMVSGNAARYTATITPTNVGDVTVGVAADVATYSSGGDTRTNAAAATLTVTYSGPTVTITGPSGPVNGEFGITITFSEAVAGLLADEIMVGNGDLVTGSFSGSGTTYLARVDPTADGSVTVDVAGGVAQKVSTTINNVAAQQFSVDADLTAPTVLVERARSAPLRTGSEVEFTIKFSEPIFGFMLSDVAVTAGATLREFAVTKVNQDYEVTVIPLGRAGGGAFTVSVPANAATDLAGNGNLMSTPLSFGPPSPTVTASSGRGYGLVVTWNTPSDSTNLTGYEVRYREPGGSFAVVQHSDTGNRTLTIDNLDGSKSYEVGVRALYTIDGSQQAGLWSASVTASPNEPPVVSVGSAMVDFVENGTGPITTVTTSDPDTATVPTIDFTGADGSLFETRSGPMGFGFQNPPDFESRGDADADNEYQVTVRATDEFGLSATANVTVTVTDDAGELDGFAASSETATRGVALSVQFGKARGTPMNLRWQWDRAAANAPTDWRAILGARSAMYTPRAVDVGHHLRVRLTYTLESIEMTEVKDFGAVQANDAPAFASDAVTDFTVMEFTAPGFAIGDPITATDPNGDELTYAVEGAGATLFEIDSTSGQLRVADGAEIEHQTDGTQPYTFTVRATDDGGQSATLEVTVAVPDTDPDPGVMLGLQEGSQFNTEVQITARLSGAGSTSDVRWQWQVTDDNGATYTDIPGAIFATFIPRRADVNDRVRAVAWYTSGGVRFRLASGHSDQIVQGEQKYFNSVSPVDLAENRSGAEMAVVLVQSRLNNIDAHEVQFGQSIQLVDSSSDGISSRFRVTTGSRRNESPDFGNYFLPYTLEYIGSGEDFETESQIVLRVRFEHGDRKYADALLIVNVTNEDEPGSIATLPSSVEVGTALMPEITDEDGGVADAQWVWERSDNNGTDWTPITDATSQAYAPTAERIGTDKLLRVSVSYRDGASTGATDRRTLMSNAVTVTARQPTSMAALAGPYQLSMAETPTIDLLSPLDVRLGSLVPSGFDTSGGVPSYEVTSGDPDGEFEIRDGALYYIGYGEDHEVTPRIDLQLRVDHNSIISAATVTVTVTDENDPGMVTFNSSSAPVGVPITATVADQDGSVSGATWHWFTVDTDGVTNPISGTTAASYTPTITQLGRSLRATVTYTDAFGPGQSAASSRLTIAPNPQMPAAPTVAASLGLGYGLMVTWGAPSNGTDLASYEVRHREVGGTFTTIEHSDTGNLALTIDSLEGGKLYEVGVRALFTAGGGTNPGPWSVSTTASPNEPPVIEVGAAEIDFAENGTDAITTVTTSDPDTATAPTIDFTGADGGLFETRDGDSDTEIGFRSPPDFESRGDADSDNAYQVSVRATDEFGLSATTDVTVTVTDVEELDGFDASAETAARGVPLLVEYGKPTGTLANLRWQWDRALASAPTDWRAILGARSSTYTPRPADVGYHLRVRLTYTLNSVEMTDVKEFGEVQTVTDFTVLEFTAPGFAIGDPVSVANPNGGSLTYSLEGAGSTQFDIDSASGQLRVAEDAEIRYQRNVTQPYTFTVRATGAGGQSGTLAVTVTVQDVNPDPEVTLEPSISGVFSTDSELTARLGRVVSPTIVRWQWQETADDGVTYTDISDAFYNPFLARQSNAGKKVRAMVWYRRGGVLFRVASARTAEAVRFVDPGSTAAPEFAALPPVDLAENRSGATTPIVLVEEIEDVGDRGGRLNDVSFISSTRGRTIEIAASNIDDVGTKFQVVTGAWIRGAPHYPFGHYPFTVQYIGSGEDHESESRIVLRLRYEYSQQVHVERLLIVNVTNVEEPGSIADLPGTTEVGTVLMPELVDGDGGFVDVQWTWERSDNNGTDWTPIPGATSRTYTPTAERVGTDKLLRVTVSYLDGTSTTDADRRTLVSNAITVTARQPASMAALAGPYRFSMPETPIIDRLSPLDVNLGSLVPSGLNTSGGFPPYEIVSGDPDGEFEIRIGVLYYIGYGEDHEATPTIDLGLRVTHNGITSAATVTVTITNEDDPDADDAGTVVLNTDSPQVGVPTIATVVDPDESVSGEMWDWFRVDASDAASPIPGANAASYTPVAADVGHRLYVTASYSDALGAGRSARSDTTTNAVTINQAPIFAAAAAVIAEGSTPTNRLLVHARFDLNENAPGDSTPVAVGTVPTATDPDNTVGSLRYTIAGGDAASVFELDSATRELTYVGAGENFETIEATHYLLTIRVADAGNLSADSMVQVVIQDQQDPGVVTLEPETPLADVEVVASLTDEDTVIGTVTWVWEIGEGSPNVTWTPVGIDSPTYTPTRSDGNKQLRATATYADSLGRGQSASGVGSVLVDETAPTVTVGPEITVTQTGPFDITVTFNEAVEQFDEADLTASVTNGTVSNFAGTAPTDIYTATITPDSDGAVVVNIGAGVAQDLSGNLNEPQAAPFTVQADITAPTVTVGPEIIATQTGAFDITITFSEAVEEFVEADLSASVTNGTVSNFVGTAPTDIYTATITPDGDGEVTVNIGAGVARDLPGNLNDAQAAPFTVQADITAPTVTFPESTPLVPNPVTGAFDIAIEFSEEVENFVQADVQVTNGAVTMFSGVPPTAGYSAKITPTANGPVTVNIPASAAQDLAGNQSAALSEVFTRDATVTDLTVEISEPPTITNLPLEITITFSEAIDPATFVAEDILVGGVGGSASALESSATPGEVNVVFTATVTPPADGTVTIDIAAGTVTAASTMHLLNEAAEQRTYAYDATAPGVDDMDAPSTAQTETFRVTITFDEVVEDFTVDDIESSLGASSLGKFTGNDGDEEYTVEVTPTAGVQDGSVDIRLDGSDFTSVTDVAGNGYTGQDSVTVAFDTLAPTPTITAPTGTQGGNFDITVDFGETVTGFTTEDIDLNFGSVESVTPTGDAQTFTARIAPGASGSLTIDIAANAAQDLPGNQSLTAVTETATVELEFEISIATAAEAVTEGGAAVTLTLELDPVPPAGASFSVPVRRTFGGGATAADGDDLTENASVTASGTSELYLIAVTGTTATFDTVAVGDRFWEPGESFSFELADDDTALWPPQLTAGSDDAVTVSITESLDPPQVRLSITPANLAEAGGANETTIMATIDSADPRGQLAAAYTLNLSFAGAATHTGTPASDDFSVDATSIALPADGTDPTATVTLTVRNDSEAESSAETIEIGGTVADGSGMPVPAISVAGTAGRIVDVQRVTLTLDGNASGAEPTGGGTLTFDFTVALTASPATELSLPVALTGTATAGDDYTAPATPAVTFAQHTDTLTGSFSIAVRDDAVVEVDETIIVALDDSVAGLPAGIQIDSAAISLTISDDTTDTAELSIAGPATEVHEGNAAEFTITLSQAIGVGVAVPWRIALADPVTAGDFDAAIGTEIMPAGSPAGYQHTVSIMVADDSDDEEEMETFEVSLDTPSSALGNRVTINVAQGSATAEIPTKVAGPDEAAVGPSTGPGYGLNVIWTEPELTAGITGYEVQYRVFGDVNFTTVSHSAVTREVDVPILTPTGTALYEARVRTAYGSSYSRWSDVSSGSASEYPTVTVADSADSNPALVVFPENSTSPSKLFSAIDPDDSAEVLTWSLSEGGRSFFSLIVGDNPNEYRIAPIHPFDYESLLEREYNPLLQVTDRFGQRGSMYLSVRIENVEEPGTLAFSSHSPRAGQALGITLTELDGITASGVAWTLERVKNSIRDGNGAITDWGTKEEVTGGVTSGAYTPQIADVGYHLRVQVKYSDLFEPSADRELALVTTDIVFPPVGDPDTVEIVEDGSVTADDIYVIYQAVQRDFAALVGDGSSGGEDFFRDTFLGPLVRGRAGATDQELLAKANELLDYNVTPSLDINGNQEIDEWDIELIFIAFTLPELVGDGSEFSGFQSFRAGFIGPLLTTPNPTDEQVRAAVRRAREFLP